MSFAVPADAYDRFMGVYSVQLAPQFVDFAGVEPGQRALDVGCGPGALAGLLAERLGADAVAAVDPSESFVDAARERHPNVDIRLATAEALPFADGEFDVTVAQLVVHLMDDPAAGLAEMVRVTRGDGVVAASVWDFAGERAPLTPLWRAALELDPDVEDESALAGAREGHLRELLETAGLWDVEGTELVARVEYARFEQWWEPFTRGVGPAGAYVASLEPERQAEVRERCRGSLPPPPFTLETYAWAARGRKGSSD